MDYEFETEKTSMSKGYLQQTQGVDEETSSLQKLTPSKQSHLHHGKNEGFVGNFISVCTMPKLLHASAIFNKLYHVLASKFMSTVLRVNTSYEHSCDIAISCLSTHASNRDNDQPYPLTAYQRMRNTRKKMQSRRNIKSPTN